MGPIGPRYLHKNSTFTKVFRTASLYIATKNCTYRFVELVFRYSDQLKVFHLMFYWRFEVGRCRIVKHVGVYGARNERWGFIRFAVLVHRVLEAAPLRHPANQKQLTKRNQCILGRIAKWSTYSVLSDMAIQLEVSVWHGLKGVDVCMCCIF